MPANHIATNKNKISNALLLLIMPTEEVTDNARVNECHADHASTEQKNIHTTTWFFGVPPFPKTWSMS